MDVEQLLRLRGTVEGSAATDPRTGGQGLVASYPRIRVEVASAIDGGEKAAEFDRLFPTTLSTHGQPWIPQAEEVKLILGEMAGWLDGVVNGAAFDRRIRVEAAAKAAEEAKRPGFN